MSHFSTALRQCLDRTFGNKIISLAAASGLPDPEIGRLLREKTPLTAAKLEKLVAAEGVTPDDKTLLIHAAIRDFVGEEIYRARFAPDSSGAEILTDSLGGPVFHSLFPLNPRAEQVLRYLIHKAGHDPDVEQMLVLMGKFLELPLPENFETEEEAPIKKGNVKYKAG